VVDLLSSLTWVLYPFEFYNGLPDKSVQVCVNVYSLEKVLRYRNFIWSNYSFSDPGFD
jgi:hypothetical protein